MAVKKVTATLDKLTEELNGKQDIYSGELTAPKKNGNYDVLISAYDDAGNVSLSDNNLVEVTLWHTPKTDWKPTDRFNIHDYNRIKNNLVYLHEKAVSLCRPFDIEDMGPDYDERLEDLDFLAEQMRKGLVSPYELLWDVDIFNMFEQNLEEINRNIFTKDYGYSQQFFANGPFIRWDELNRIESAILSMNEILERQKAGLRRLSFRLGTFKEVKI